MTQLISRILGKILTLFRRGRVSIVSTLSGQDVSIGPGATLQAPLRISGKGLVQLGRDNFLGVAKSPKLGSGDIYIQARSLRSKIVIGDRNWFNNNVAIIAQECVEIGDGCQIGDQVAIYDCDFHALDPAERTRSPGNSAPVRIGTNVWLGSRVMVLKGVTIGDNSVIGAMSLVTKSIPANSVAVGIPAKVIRSL